MEIKQLDNIWAEWKIEDLLGEGASGKVYKAKRKDIQDTYSAIKIIEIPQNESEIREAESEGMEEAEVREYFKGFVDDLVEEITLLESLKEAKGIVGISDYKVVEKEGTIGWTIYIRMELLTGINKVINQKTVTEEDIINLGLDLSEALEYCEKLKIIHRDIKPENIFVSKFGEYKLGDFGIARRLENTSSIMSKKGTYLYMPPEVYRGEEYDKTVDLYSLGLVMYKLGNDNRTPFLPKPPNPITYRDKEKALMMRMQGEKIEKPENISNELFAIIEKMIAYKPSERYQSAKQVKQDLERLKERLANKYEGTVNIFTHKSKIKREEVKTEVITEDEVKAPVIEEQVIEQPVIEKTVIEAEEVVQKEIMQQKETAQPEKIEEIQKQEINEPIHTENKEKSKNKVIIVIVAILLLIAIIIGIIKLTQKGSTEQMSNTVIMPNLINLTQEEAELQIEGKELEVTYQDTYQEGAEKGKIVYQSISADTEIEKGCKIVVFINNLEKDQVEKVIMPRVIDLNIAQAMEQLLGMGLQVEKIEENHDTVEKDIVLEQDIAENTEIIKGSKVVLKVSLGKIEEIKQEEQHQQQNQQPPTNNQQNNNNTSSNNTNSIWSDWIANLPSGINNSNSKIETKTQYSYRTKETTSSTQNSLPGWNFDSSKTSTTQDWGSNKTKQVTVTTTKSPASGPTTTGSAPVESANLRIVNKQESYVYGHYVQYEGERAGGSFRGASLNSESYKYHEKASSKKIKLTDFIMGETCPQCIADDPYNIHSMGSMWFVEKVITTYTYQEKESKNIYTFYRWSDWSAYSDTVANANSTTEVRTRTLYRYKAK